MVVRDESASDFVAFAFNTQSLDWDGLRRRALSSSYLPLPGHPGHEPMMAELRELFAAHGREGRVRIDYVKN